MLLASLFIILLVCFAGVLLFGAPYLPTLSKQIDAAIKLTDMPAGGHLLELGCGDGRVMLAALKRGYRVTGYELNPLLVIICWIRLLNYRGRGKVIWGNFWLKELPPADAIFVFLLPKYMKKLDTKVMQYKHKPVKLISFAFKIPNKTIKKEEDGVFLYDYR